MRSEERASSSFRSQRTHPALPGATASTFPLNTQKASVSIVKRGPDRYSGYGDYSGFSSYRRVILPLLVLGVLLELAYLALYPLLAYSINTGSDVGKQTPHMQQVQSALPTLLPWLPHLYWTNGFPALLHVLAALPALNLLDTHNQSSAATLLATCVLLFAALLVLLASRIGNFALRDSSAPIAAPFVVMLLMAALLA